MDMDIYRIIKSKPALRDLFRNAPKMILSQFTILELPAHKIIIKKGEPNRYIFISCSGRLRISNEFDNGRIYEFASVKDIGFSGLLEFFAEKEIASSMVETVSDTVLLRIRKDKFSHWLNRDNTAFRKVVAIFANQMYPSILTTGVVFAHSGIYCLAQYIERHMEKDIIKFGVSVLPNSRQELAENLGLSLRTIYRLVLEMKNRKFISVVKRKIYVNRNQFKRLVAFLEEYDI